MLNPETQDDTNPNIKEKIAIFLYYFMGSIWTLALIVAFSVLLATIGASVLHDFGANLVSISNIAKTSALGGVIIGSPMAIGIHLLAPAPSLSIYPFLWVAVLQVAIGAAGAAALKYSGAAVGYAAASILTGEVTLLLTLGIVAIGFMACSAIYQKYEPWFSQYRARQDIDLNITPVEHPPLLRHSNHAQYFTSPNTQSTSNNTNNPVVAPSTTTIGLNNSQQ